MGVSYYLVGRGGLGLASPKRERILTVAGLHETQLTSGL